MDDFPVSFCHLVISKVFIMSPAELLLLSFCCVALLCVLFAIQFFLTAKTQRFKPKCAKFIFAVLILKMIMRENAIKVAQCYLEELQAKTRHDLVLLFDSTIEFELGWVFFYQSKAFVETGDIGEMLGGNAPIIGSKQAFAAENLNGSNEKIWLF